MIFENDRIYIETEPFEIPWLKIFAKAGCKEMSQCDEETKRDIFKALDIIERAMLRMLTPDKINIASFGNYVPKVHWHIQARYRNDSYFPEPVWGAKQRTGSVRIENLDQFYEEVTKRLQEEL